MTDESDEEIWRRVVAGDARQFGVIWDRHHARIFRTLISAGSSAAEAEDLTAAAFLELWRRRRNVRFVDASVLPWLIVTARNVFRNSARARRRYERFLAALPPHPVVADHADGVADRGDERAAALRAAMQAARPDDAALLVLTALEGFTVREAAAALGITEPAAKMRLSRLRTKLRAEIGPQLVIEGAP